MCERERERDGVRVSLPCIFVRVACEYIYIFLLCWYFKLSKCLHNCIMFQMFTFQVHIIDNSWHVNMGGFKNILCMIIDTLLLKIFSAGMRPVWEVPLPDAFQFLLCLIKIVCTQIQ